MKRTAKPDLSTYERWLCEREDLAPASIRNYLSDLRQFMAWYELTEMTRDSQYSGYLLRSKSATGRVHGTSSRLAIWWVWWVWCS